MKHGTPNSFTRRFVLGLPGSLLACAGAPQAPLSPPAEGAPGELGLALWRTLAGGFPAVAAPLTGKPVRPNAAAYAKLVAPTAVALLGDDLLVADSGTQRIWRADLGFNTLTALPGAVATPTTALALAPDLSAWVLDGVAGQVRRFARDGRLLQTLRLGPDAVAPTALALADAGATLLVADGGLRQWLEFRPVGGFATSVRAQGLLRGVDALAANGAGVWVLDRSSGLVHRVNRAGQVLASLGAGVLKQPVALAVDRQDRVWVLDAQDHSLKLLREDRAVQVFDAARLRVQQPAALSVSEGFLAVADRLGGQIVVLRVLEARP